MFNKLKNYIESFKAPYRVAMEALLRHKMRAVLTILGITVGITAVIVVLSAGQAIEGFITGQISQFGTDFINVEIKVPSTGHASAENASGQAQGITITTLKEADGEAIKKLSNVKDVYAGQIGQSVFSYRDENKVTMVFGVTASFDTIDPHEIAQGRFFNDGEDKSLSRVVVLGSNVKKDIFGDEEALGKSVKIAKQSYKVIGVMKERGSAGIFSMDDVAFIPLRTLQKIILGIDYVQMIYVKVEDVSKSDLTVDDITLLMRDRHDIDDPTKDDFAVMSAEQGLEMMKTITGVIKLLLFAIACISLIVGGVGIMNIMYVSVAERTFEIGLRKALGAKYASILRQFLSEAVIITFSGGIVGIILGTIISFLFSLIAGQLGYALQFSITFSYILLAVSVSVLVGLISGLWPARAAAKLEPMVALRKE